MLSVVSPALELMLSAAAELTGVPSPHPHPRTCVQVQWVLQNSPLTSTSQSTWIIFTKTHGEQV